MQYYLVLAAVLFAIGLFGVITRRNTIGVLMSLELMFNAANINLVTFNRYVVSDVLVGQMFAIFVVVVAAAEATIGLAIVLLIYRNWQNIDTDKYSLMKW
jgi:NADH:ubiquinone oxidoreductase subunit K